MRVLTYLELAFFSLVLTEQESWQLPEGPPYLKAQLTVHHLIRQEIRMAE